MSSSIPNAAVVAAHGLHHNNEQIDARRIARRFAHGQDDAWRRSRRRLRFCDPDSSEPAKTTFIGGEGCFIKAEASGQSEGTSASGSHHEKDPGSIRSGLSLSKTLMSASQHVIHVYC